MASREFAAIKHLYATVRQNDVALTLAQQRAEAEHFSDLAVEPEGLNYRYDEVNGVRVLVITPADADPRFVIEYLHGGGYQKCSVESHRKMVGHIANAAGVAAVSVDYRLTPEHRHPAPVEDSLAVYQWLLGNGYAPDQVVVAGDSAGGGLALGTALALKDAGIPLPAALVAISPWTDMTLSGDSMVSRAKTDIGVREPYLVLTRDDFVTRQQWDDPRASPLAGDLALLPPTYLMAGDDEILRDDALRFGMKAGAAGVDVTFDIVPEMQHVMTKAVGAMPESDAAVARIGCFIRSVLLGRI
jgi:monoterpene epsilon-lactone hydrolase